MKKLLALTAALALAGTAAAQPIAAATTFGDGVRIHASLGLGGGGKPSVGVTVGFGGHGHNHVHVHGGGHGSHGKHSKKWVPGHWETRVEHYTVPARTQRIWCEPVYTYKTDSCGHVYKVLVSPGHWDVVVIEPARVECRNVRVWVPGGWC